MGSEDDEWTWKFAPRAAKQFGNLEHHVQDRIVSKLDKIVDDPWRDPGDYLEPLNRWALREASCRAVPTRVCP